MSFSKGKTHKGFHREDFCYMVKFVSFEKHQYSPNMRANIYKNYNYYNNGTKS